MQLILFPDVDECATGRASCPRFRQCVNTFGSYICKCHKGFDLMYIGGKYQCHGNDPGHHCFVLLLPMARKGLLAVLLTGVPGAGEGAGIKQTEVHFSHCWFWMHTYCIVCRFRDLHIVKKFILKMYM